MKALLLIGHNDLRLFLRERTSLIWLFVVPLGFTFFMGFAVRGPGNPSNPRPAVVIENHDTGFVGRVFLDRLGTQGLRVVSPTNQSEARIRLQLPADLTTRVLSGQGARMGYAEIAGAPDGTAAMAELRVVRALIDLNSLLLEHATAYPNRPLTEPALTNLLAQRHDLVVLQASFAGRKPAPTGYRLSVPGNLTAYLMMNLLIFGGAGLAWERRSGVLRRLAVHPVSPLTIVGGKIYGLLLLAAVQSTLLLLAGRLLFQVPFGDQLPGILLTLVVYSWVAASLGVLIGSLFQAEEKIVGLCILLSMGMAALGGCWWPLEIVPPWMKTLAHCVPTGWAMDAFHRLITFGGGIGEAAGAIGMLALFAVAATLGAARWFRY